MKKILLFLSVVLLSGVATSQEMIYDEAGAQRLNLIGLKQYWVKTFEGLQIQP